MTRFNFTLLVVLLVLTASIVCDRGHAGETVDKAPGTAQATVILHRHIARAVSEGKEITAGILLGTRRSQVKLVQCHGDKVVVQLIGKGASSARMSLGWNHFDAAALVDCACSLAVRDGQALLAALTIAKQARLTQSGENLLQRIRRSGDAALSAMATEVWGEGPEESRPVPKPRAKKKKVSRKRTERIWRTTLPARTPRENCRVTLEMDFPMHDVLVEDYASPVVTYNGCIYAAWIDDQLRTMIAKKEPGGGVRTSVIFEKTIGDDKYHVGPAVGIDNDGFIHVAGNMHHSPHHLPDFVPVKSAWQYVVSDQPEDISSFTFCGVETGTGWGLPQRESGPDARTPPGRSITYPFFASSNDGDLYLAFRHRVKYNSGWSPGILGGAIARYDDRARNWSMLGGTDYVHRRTTLFWTAKPGGGTAYQGFKVRIFFDKYNRMHVVTNLHERGRVSLSTHVAYAYSDDGGKTFHKADGAAYASYPITLQTADIVVGPPWVDSHTLYNKSEVGVTADGRPMVTFNKRGDKAGNYACFWNPETGWAEPRKFPGLYFFTDAEGTVTVPRGRSMQRSFDKGKTWQSYEMEAGTCLVDFRHLATTGQVRFRTLRDGRFKVWTATFK